MTVKINTFFKFYNWWLKTRKIVFIQVYSIINHEQISLSHYFKQLLITDMTLTCNLLYLVWST